MEYPNVPMQATPWAMGWPQAGGPGGYPAAGAMTYPMPYLPTGPTYMAPAMHGKMQGMPMMPGMQAMPGMGAMMPEVEMEPEWEMGHAGMGAYMVEIPGGTTAVGIPAGQAMLNLPGPAAGFGIPQTEAAWRIPGFQIQMDTPLLQGHFNWPGINSAMIWPAIQGLLQLPGLLFEHQGENARLLARWPDVAVHLMPDAPEGPAEQPAE